MSIHDTEIVSALRLAIANGLGQKRFDMWFGPTSRLLVEELRVRVEVGNRFALDWIRQNFRGEVETASRAILGPDAVVEFRVDPQLQARRTRSTSASGECTEPTTLAETAADADDAMRASTATYQDTLAVHSAQSSRALQSTQASQTSRETSARPLSTFEQFVVGDCNRIAHASAAVAVRQLGTTSPLLFAGPTGSGKTHLLEAMCHAVRLLPGRSRCLMLSAELFTRMFLEALHGSGLPNFRRRYQDVDVLILDNVHFFENKRATLDEVLFTIDAVLHRGRQVVLATNRASLPELAGLGPELVSRISHGLVCQLQLPDPVTRSEILRGWAKQRQLPLSDAVVDWIVDRFPEDPRQLSGALNRLFATTLAWGVPVSLTMAQDALADLITGKGSSVRLDDIERAVCEVFGLQAQSLKSGQRSKGSTQPRMLAMYLARKHTRAALSEIGAYFGRRSHATVVAAQKRVCSWMSDDARMTVAHGDCAIRDAVRQIENRLKTG